MREYTAEELRELLLRHFSEVECLGVAGNERVMEYYAANKASVERVARFDVFDLQHRLPRRLLRIPYDILNRINRRRLLADNRDLTQSITMDDYRIGPVTEESFRPLLHCAKRTIISYSVEKTARNFRFIPICIIFMNRAATGVALPANTSDL